MSADLNDFRGGAIAIDKPYGMTSHDAVARARRLYGTKKVGHTGTLDPMATGVLVLLVGRAVKASDMLVLGRKRYFAKMKLGLTSDTEDITGTLTYSSAPIPKRKEVVRVVSKFKGDIMQVPPMYSALKVGGEKLVDLARRGITVERAARLVTIYDISANGDGEDYELFVECSKGTYIRTLINDIGAALGCGAVMSGLCRTYASGFEISEAYTLERLEEMGDAARLSALSPCETMFSELCAVDLPDFYKRLFINGCEIYQKKIGTSFPVGALLRVYGAGEFIGVGEVREYGDGSAVKVKAFL